MWHSSSMPDAQQLAALPILPLPRVVLLPGMVLPVNIHEPASRALVDHVRHDGQHLGVPLASPGAPLPRVFTLARILAHVELSHGHRLIRVVGVARVEALREPPGEPPLRAVPVRALAEPRPRDPRALLVLRAQVACIVAAAGDIGLALRTALEIPDDRVFLYALTACLPALELLPHRDLPDAELDPDDLTAVQQRSLAAADADERADLLVARTSAVLAGLASRDRPTVRH